MVHHQNINQCGVMGGIPIPFANNNIIMHILREQLGLDRVGDSSNNNINNIKNRKIMQPAWHSPLHWEMLGANDPEILSRLGATTANESPP